MDNFIFSLNKHLQNTLPGKKAHLEMMPTHIDFNITKKLNDAGVLLLLFPDNNDIYSVLIKRTSIGPHANQISFPGGKKEKSDNSLEDTALRETEEEIGLSRKNIKIIGNLSSLIIPPSAYYVHPFVGYVNFKPDFILNKFEVKYLIFFDVKYFINNTKKEFLYKNMQNYTQKIPYFKIDNENIWGATAMILNEFRKIAEKCI